MDKLYFYILNEDGTVTTREVGYTVRVFDYYLEEEVCNMRVLSSFDAEVFSDTCARDFSTYALVTKEKRDMAYILKKLREYVQSVADRISLDVIKHQDAAKMGAKELSKLEEVLANIDFNMIDCHCMLYKYVLPKDDCHIRRELVKVLERKDFYIVLGKNIVIHKKTVGSVLKDEDSYILYTRDEDDIAQLDRYIGDEGEVWW